MSRNEVPAEGIILARPTESLSSCSRRRGLRTMRISVVGSVWGRVAGNDESHLTKVFSRWSLVDRCTECRRTVNGWFAIIPTVTTGSSSDRSHLVVRNEGHQI
jgi:hypothetical protein